MTLVPSAAGALERRAEEPATAVVARAVAVCGRGVPASQPWNDSFGTVEIEGIPVLAGVVPVGRPPFDPASAEHARSALVRVRAFSCNFRDRSWLLQAAAASFERGIWVVGSELAAEVVAVGAGVDHVAPGDRVMGQNSWPDAHADARSQGLPTNHAARELLVVPADRLVRMPDGMTWETAAAFSLGAQTAYAMARKVHAREGAHVLVTAARSSTSLFTIGALRTRGARVYATTTSDGWDDRLREAGAHEVFRTERDGGPFANDPAIGRVARAIDGFDAVIDPFLDLHLPRVAGVMAFGGRYVSCGVHAQLPKGFAGRPGTPAPAFGPALFEAVVRNLRILGNCLGTPDDLRDAMEDWRAGRLSVPIDSVYRDGQAAAFLDRTYNAPDRFGKVVYSYL